MSSPLFLFFFVTSGLFMFLDAATTTYISYGVHKTTSAIQFFKKSEHKHVESAVVFFDDIYTFTKTVDACKVPIKYCNTKTPNSVSCMNATEHSWTCSCEPGYYSTSGDGLNCVDTNECQWTAPNAVCNSTQTCVNTIGAFRCDCIGNSVMIDGVCDLNECLSPNDCSANSNCKNTKGSYECVCHANYLKSRVGKNCMQAMCTETKNPCGSHSQCTNIVTNSTVSFNCSCINGYQSDNSGRNCYDTNECSNPSLFTCTSNAVCENTDGGYRCKCNQNYLSSVNGTCVLDPCLAQPCGTHFACESFQKNDFSWGRTCKCEHGLLESGGTCVDVDECTGNVTVPAASCTDNSFCVNTFGSYYCKCNKEFIRLTNGLCQKDPCLLGVTENCGINSDCWRVQTLEYTLRATCRCKTGYYSTNQKNCRDIDECTTQATICPTHSTCKNTIGSYACGCNTGYYKTANNTCAASVCTLSTCNANQTCINIYAGKVSSTVCACQPGYESDSMGNCVDKDECSSGLSPCPPNSTCTNLPGSYKCTCNQHYLPEADKCVIDPCWLNSPCGTFSKCTSHLNQGYGNEKWIATCRCYCGYASTYVNQSNCKDMDECSSSSKPTCLSGKLECKNVAGSFYWKCNEKYIKGVENISVAITKTTDATKLDYLILETATTSPEVAKLKESSKIVASKIVTQTAIVTSKLKYVVGETTTAGAIATTASAMAVYLSAFLFFVFIF